MTPGGSLGEFGGSHPPKGVNMAKHRGGTVSHKFYGGAAKGAPRGGKKPPFGGTWAALERGGNPS